VSLYKLVETLLRKGKNLLVGIVEEDCLCQLGSTSALWQVLAGVLWYCACMARLWQAGSSSNVLTAGASRCLLLGWCRK